MRRRQPYARACAFTVRVRRTIIDTQPRRDALHTYEPQTHTRIDTYIYFAPILHTQNPRSDAAAAVAPPSSANSCRKLHSGPAVIITIFDDGFDLNTCAFRNKVINNSADWHATLAAHRTSLLDGIPGRSL